MNLSSFNIKISVSLRALVFKEYFGLLFYDSNSEYPGYIFLNYSKIISENKVDCKRIKFNILVNSTTHSFSFQDQLYGSNSQKPLDFKKSFCRVFHPLSSADPHQKSP